MRPVRILALMMGWCLAVVPVRDARAWTTNFSLPAEGFSPFSQLVTYDGAGDVLVGGTFTTLDEKTSFAQTLKYDGTGALIWRSLLRGTRAEGNGFTTFATNSVFAITVDADDNPVIAGRSTNVGGAGIFSFLAAKLNKANGHELWRYEIAVAFGRAADVVVDADGDVIVVGSYAEAPSNDALIRRVVVKLAGATGQQIWRKEVVTATPVPNAPSDVAIAADGSIGVVAKVGDSILATKLAADTGDPIWSTTFAGNDGPALAIDPSGHFYVSGQRGGGGNPTFGLLVKLDDATGNELWRKEIGDGAVDVVADAAGVVWTSYDLEGSGGAGTTFLTAHAPDGTQLWQRSETALKGIGNATLRLDPSGDVVATISSGEYDVALLEIDRASGAPISRRLLGGKVFRLYSADVALDPGSTKVAVVANNRPRKGQTVPEGYDVVTFVVAPETFGKSFELQYNAAKPTKNKAAVQIKDAAFVAPSAGGPADPSIAGATVTITNPTTHETFTTTLPAGNWTQKKGKYKYADKKPYEGPCIQAAVANGGWSVKCVGAGITFTLDEALQGVLSVELQARSVSSCARFGGEVVKDLPATEKKPGVFKAKGAPPAPVCP